MEKGSHNSFTFLRPQWYLRLFSFIGRCQSKTIEEQWAEGVRYFDVRIRCKEGGSPMIVHNRFVYVEGWAAVRTCIDRIAYLADRTREKAYIRVLHDVRRKEDATIKEKELFQDFCWDLEDEYIDYPVIFEGGQNLYDWTVDYDFSALFPKTPKYEECHASVCWPKWAHWWPWLYAVTHRRKVRELLENQSSTTLLFDYV